MPADSPVSLPWLIRLRWMAVAGQVLAIAMARFAFDQRLAYEALAAIVLLTALSNVALVLADRRGLLPWPSTTLMGLALTVDTLLLTGLLAAAGGAMNPFIVLYLVHITLSALMLETRWTSLIATLAVAGFGLLFLVPIDPHAHHRPEGLRLHLQGMWIAFVLATTLTAFFVHRIVRAVAEQREQLAQLRETAARNARLAAITTLAAGAAHELGSPLGTIAVAAHEARRAAASSPEAETLSDDLTLIEEEVERCRAILGQLSSSAADEREQDAVLSTTALGEALLATLDEGQRARVRLRADGHPLRLPTHQTARVVSSLVRNAIDASPPDAPVLVELRASPSHSEFSVEDRGAGMSDAVLARAGEPFFTTKQPGRGMGLGLFLARAFAESRGGGLELSSVPGKGTTARLRIPRTIEEHP